MSAAERMRKFRARRRAGTIVVRRIEIDQDVIDTLVGAGFLADWDRENAEDVARAIALLLRNITSFDVFP